MTVELSFIHWDVIDEDDLAFLPGEFKIDIVFPGDTSKYDIGWKGHIIAADLAQRVRHLTREFASPRDFFWKSSKSDRMHKWSYNTPCRWRPIHLVHFEV